MIRLFIIFSIVFIISCSNTKNDVCRINGNEYYLDTSQLCEIHVPHGLVLPLEDDKYKLPTIIDDGQLKFGKNLDICPPSVIY